jgi:hypothetical protein
MNERFCWEAEVFARRLTVGSLKMNVPASNLKLSVQSVSHATPCAPEPTNRNEEHDMTGVLRLLPLDRANAAPIKGQCAQKVPSINGIECIMSNANIPLSPMYPPPATQRRARPGHRDWRRRLKGLARNAWLPGSLRSWDICEPTSTVCSNFLRFRGDVLVHTSTRPLMAKGRLRPVESSSTRPDISTKAGASSPVKKSRRARKPINTNGFRTRAFLYRIMFDLNY